MNGIIIYKGKYGATTQYSEWLAKTLRIPAVGAGNISADDLSKFDVLILGSSVYIGKLQLKNWMKENISVLQRKMLFIFIVCGTPADEKVVLQKIVRDNVPEEIRNRCEIYFLPGRLIMKNVSLLDKILLRLGAVAAKNPAEKKRMLEGFDGMNEASLNPIVSSVKAGLTNKQGRPLEVKPLK
jgi:menaquinone-dependent protoporphyrinogen IX oxidase